MTISAPSSSALDTTRALLTAADTDIAAFFALFTDDCQFRMANNEVIHGRDAIQAWVAQYLGSVAGMRHVILEEWAADAATTTTCTSPSSEAPPLHGPLGRHAEEIT